MGVSSAYVFLGKADQRQRNPPLGREKEAGSAA
jgi:hypothetical protein